MFANYVKHINNINNNDNDDFEYSQDYENGINISEPEDNKLPEDVEAAKAQIDDGRSALSEIVMNADAKGFETELQAQIDSRRKMLEYSLQKGEPPEDMKETAAEEIEELAAGMITAKTFLTKLKKGKMTIGELKDECEALRENDPSRLYGFDFKEEVDKLKDSTQFKNFSASAGKNAWENAKAMRGKALSKNGDLLYSGYTAQSAGKLSSNAGEIVKTKQKKLDNKLNNDLKIIK